MSPLDSGAKAWFDRVQARRVDGGRRRPDGRRWQWEDLTDDDRTAYRAIVRPIVEAALTGPTLTGPDLDGGIDLTADEAAAFAAELARQ